MALNHGAQFPFCGDILLSDCADISSESTQRGTQTKRRQSANHRASSASSKRAGRSPESANLTQGDDAKERRRGQVRLAQRAYRSRKIANIQALEDRIAHLQDGIQDINDAAISFSDLIMQSGVLASRPEITSHLRQMLHKCLGLAKDVGADCMREVAYPKVEEEPLLSPPVSGALHIPQPFVGEAMPPSIPIEPFQSPTRGKYRLHFHNDPLTVNASDSGEVKMSSFTQQLRLACLYNALALLKDSSTKIDDLRRPFRLLLSLVNRETIISIFEASFNARLRGREPGRFHEIAIFQLEGPESRCLEKSSQGLVQSFSHRRKRTAESSLSHSCPGDDQGRPGRWFDVQDLEQCLREKNVRLCMFPPAGPEVSSSPCISAVSLIEELAKRAICLGHSPGFERHDVDIAICLASWA